MLQNASHSKGCENICKAVYRNVVYLSVYRRELVVVGFEAADEEGLAERQSLHQGVQRLSELTAQRGDLSPLLISLQ